MTYQANRRGTVLMLVVGLLTMVAMLGSVFLISSFMDSQQTDALIVKSTGVKLSSGVASHIQGILKNDIYLGPSGPYDNIQGLDGSDEFTHTDRVMGWRAYIDYPSIDVDPWLSEFEQDEEAWRSWVFGHPAKSAVSGGGSVTQDSSLCIDTDGNGQQDAYLCDVSVMDNSGQSYNVAVRIIDTSGLLCVNTAGEPTAQVTPYTPVMVDLLDAVGQEIYDELHDARCGGSASTIEQYWEDCGSRLLEPQSNYAPFPYSDEAALRYLRPNSQSEQAKLFQILSSQGDSMRYLTTFSCSLSSMRHPVGDESGSNQGRSRVLLKEPNDIIDGNSIFKLMRLYVKFCGAIGDMNEIAGGGGGASGYVYDDGDGSLAVSGVYFAEGYNGGSKVVSTSPVSAVVIPPPPAGTYTFSARAPADPSYSTSTVITMYIFGGPMGFSMAVMDPWNQTVNGNQWQELGTVTIPEGCSGVNLSYAAGAGGKINVDAVMFAEPVQGPAPADPPACPEAAHVVANIWAYTSDTDANDEPFRFNTLTDLVALDGWCAYGVVPQLVITEAYAWFQPESDPADTAVDDSQFVVAVEMMNPYDPSDPWAEEISYEEYVVQCGADTTASDGVFGWSVKNNIPGDYMLAPGERIVFYYSGAGPEGTAPDPSAAGLSMGGGARWIECEQLKHFFTDGVAIVRNVGITKRAVPVDSVHADEVGIESNMPGSWDIVRDDDPSRQRALVPVYIERIDTNTVGTFNSLTEVDLQNDALVDVPEGFTIRRNYGPPSSVADLMDVFIVGPDSNGWDLPHKLVGKRYTSNGEIELTDGNDTRRPYHQTLARGTGHIGFVNEEPDYYPDVPWGTLIQEFIEVVPPDEYDDRMPHMRIYGRININTAPEAVLGTLPFPEEITWEDEYGQMHTAAVKPGEAVEAILSYRDLHRALWPGRLAMNAVEVDFHPKGGGIVPRSTWMEHLALNIADPDDVLALYMREVSNCGGFLTPGEVAVPLAWYADYLMGIESDPGSEIRKQAGYLEARDSLYRAIANHITVNSTTFAATARAQRGTSSAASATRSVMVFDRGNCQGGSGEDNDHFNDPRYNQPAILLNVEVR